MSYAQFSSGWNSATLPCLEQRYLYRALYFTPAENTCKIKNVQETIKNAYFPFFALFVIFALFVLFFPFFLFCTFCAFYLFAFLLFSFFTFLLFLYFCIFLFFYFCTLVPQSIWISVQNIECVSQKCLTYEYFCNFCTYVYLQFLQIVHTKFHAKSGVSSSKN